MKAVLLLLALCGLTAAYAISPTAQDVRETGKVSPIDPVGELSSPALTRELSAASSNRAALRLYGGPMQRLLYAGC